MHSFDALCAAILRSQDISLQRSGRHSAAAPLCDMDRDRIRNEEKNENLEDNLKINVLVGFVDELNNRSSA